MFKTIWRNPYLLYEITSSNHNQLALDAAGVGHLDYLQHTDFLIYDNEIIRAIIKNGHLHVLQWLCKTRKVVFFQTATKCPTKFVNYGNSIETAMTDASIWNRFEIIKWLYENVVPLTDIVKPSVPTVPTPFPASAVSPFYRNILGLNTNTNTTTELEKNKKSIGFIHCNNDYDDYVETKWDLTYGYLYHQTIRNNNLEMLKWFYYNSPDFNEYIIEAILKNNLDESLLQWFQENRKNCGNVIKSNWFDIYHSCSMDGNLDILKWLYENHQSFMIKYFIFIKIKSLMMKMSSKNDIEKIKWLYSQL